MSTNKAIELETAMHPMRDALLLWVGLLAVSLSSLLFVGYKAERVVQQEVRSLAEKTADLTAIIIDESGHARFAREGKMWSLEHKTLIEPLLDLHRRFPEAKRLRTLVQEGGQMLVILDTEAFAGEVGMNRPVNPQSMRSTLDDTEGHASLARRALQSNDAVTENESTPGPFGDFLTAAVPMDGGGAVLATVDVSQQKQAQQRIIDVVFIGCGISLIVSTLIAIGFFNIRSLFLQVTLSEDEAQRGQAWQQARNQRVVEALGQLVLHRDLKNHCLLWSGDPVGILGFLIERMPLNAADWEARVHPDDIEPLRLAVAGVTRRANAFEIEYRVRSESADWIWFLERGVVTFDDTGESPLAVDSVLLDITEKKHAAERLAALALIASRTDNAVCLTLTDGTIEWVNDAFEKVTGFDRTDSLKKPLATLVAPTGTASAEVRKMIAGASQKSSQVAEIELSNKNYQPYWAHLEIQPLTNEEGEVKKLVAIQSDRSAAKEFESRLVRAKDAAEAADRAKSEFLAVMSHEVRTPLNAVIGFTGLLMDSRLTDQQRDYLKTIQSSGESLLSLVNDILDFSRMEADKFILEKTHFDIRQTIEGTLEILGAAAAKKGLELVCDLASETPGSILGDQARLKQVILNLAGNAVKFTDDGEVVISVRVVSKLGDSMRLRFEVRDTGPGIDLDQQAELFKPFSQADSTATRKHGGTGLGLAISKRLVKLMGGDIGLQSTPGHGSNFWFELPTEAPEDQDSDLAEGSRLRGQSVLLVEYNTALRAVISNQLTRWGMQVKGFSRGRDAVYASDQRRFDVAIIDTNTPDIAASRLSERLRRSPRGGVDRIVILEMPGHEIDHSVIIPSMVEVIRKPLRISHLFEMLLRTTPDARVQSGEGMPVVPESNQPVPAVHKLAIAPIETPPPDHDQPAPIAKLPRVLVADDNAVNRKLVAKMLTKMGFEFEMAENGLEALRAVESAEFDAILMDIQMPEMDGLEATRQIRERGYQLPIIAITADAMPDDQTRCAAAGMNDYLSKPVRAAALEASLNHAIGKVPA